MSIPPYQCPQGKSSPKAQLMCQRTWPNRDSAASRQRNRCCGVMSPIPREHSDRGLRNNAQGEKKFNGCVFVVSDRPPTFTSSTSVAAVLPVISLKWSTEIHSAEAELRQARAMIGASVSYRHTLAHLTAIIFVLLSSLLVSVVSVDWMGCPKLSARSPRPTGGNYCFFSLAAQSREVVVGSTGGISAQPSCCKDTIKANYNVVTH
ncbi:uncharacterized protein BDR25DRAFT_312452 [Lindgomyces ingoldianus]|uniref:Uncharacterized protein n=1 Tax=Lindgomyces ingoldianus TaxID=673940 RepID=A0ACB6R2G5_9PLEO|nr:uncharacterized protein BDR25DRAFT_312452 [Lindgomyces ingoldianus]KAF2473371.1 hypothetical protein BDR25DRAFT_312452 [Lindgomyces ingoldianus]